jgi:hypothetical protein
VDAVENVMQVFVICHTVNLFARGEEFTLELETRRDDPHFGRTFHQGIERIKPFFDCLGVFYMDIDNVPRCFVAPNHIPANIYPIRPNIYSIFFAR